MNLIGYWNGDENNPDIVFDTSLADCYKLCSIKITVIPQKEEIDVGRKLSNSLDKAYKGARSLDKAFKGISRKK